MPFLPEKSRTVSYFINRFKNGISARNRERLALIEKGAEASIFYSKNKWVTPIWKVIVINLALLLMGIGIGIFVAAMLHYNLGVDEEVAYPGTIFLLAGIGLFVGFILLKNLIKTRKFSSLFD